MIIQKRSSVKRFLKSKQAFTLAEVLITLGIIGVVAAMTVPVLMQNIQEKQFKEAAKAALSKAGQAVQLMRQDQGSIASIYGGTTGSFEPEFVKYFKVVKDCGNADSCVPAVTGNSSNIFKTLVGNKADTEYMQFGQFITTDGMFWGIYNWSGYPHIMLTVDVNGYQKPPNQYGKDVFMFEIVNDNVVPMGGPNTSIGSAHCMRTWDAGMQGLACMEYVMEGKDY